MKACIQFVKDDTRTPLLDSNNKPSAFSRYINELIEKGVKGTLKKESVISTLQELVVIVLLVYLISIKPSFIKF